MSEPVYAQALNLIDTLAQKQHIKGLCDFEYQLYEQLCVAMGTYFGGLTFAFQISSMKTHMEAASNEEAYLAFLAKLEEAQLEKERLEREDEKTQPEE